MDLHSYFPPKCFLEVENLQSDVAEKSTLIRSEGIFWWQQRQKETVMRHCPVLPISWASLKVCCFSVPSWILRPRDDPQPAAGCLQENRMWTFKSALKRFMTVGDIVQSCYWACIQGEHRNSRAAQKWVGNLLAWRGRCFSVKANSNLLLIQTDGAGGRIATGDLDTTEMKSNDNHQGNKIHAAKYFF